MCLKSKKHVFATGLGFLTLIYLSASNLNKLGFSVLNGKGHGSSIHMENQKLPISKIPDINVCYLDNVTGDLYQFSEHFKTLISIGNTGLHDKNAAQNNKIFGQQVLQKIIHRTKEPQSPQFYALNSCKTDDITYLQQKNQKTGKIYA